MDSSPKSCSLWDMGNSHYTWDVIRANCEPFGCRHRYQIRHYILSRRLPCGKRTRLYCCLAGNQVKDVLPNEYNVRSRVHEYGRAPMAMGSDGTVIFTDVSTFGVFALSYSGTSPGGSHFFSCSKCKVAIYWFDMHPSDARWIPVVREDHRDGEGVNRNQK